MRVHIYVNIKGVSRQHCVLCYLSLWMVSSCVSLYRSRREGSLSCIFFFPFFFFLVGNCRNNVLCERNRKGKTLVDEKPGYDKCLFCSFVDSCVPLGSAPLCLKGGKNKQTKSSRMAPESTSRHKGRRWLARLERGHFLREASSALLLEHSQSKMLCNHRSRNAKFYF